MQPKQGRSASRWLSVLAGQVQRIKLHPKTRFKGLTGRFLLELPPPRISVRLSTEAMWQTINFSWRLEARGSERESRAKVWGDPKEHSKFLWQVQVHSLFIFMQTHQKLSHSDNCVMLVCCTVRHKKTSKMSTLQDKEETKEAGTALIVCNAGVFFSSSSIHRRQGCTTLTTQERNPWKELNKRKQLQRKKKKQQHEISPQQTQKRDVIRVAHLTSRASLRIWAVSTTPLLSSLFPHRSVIKGRGGGEEKNTQDTAWTHRSRCAERHDSAKSSNCENFVFWVRAGIWLVPSLPGCQ